MTTRTRSRRLRPVRVLAGLLVAASLTATAACDLNPFSDPKTKHFSADFDRAIGVYKNSDVRVLGVKIGKVDSIHNEGDHVRLDMEYDASYKIPAGAKAVLVAPSIVSDRYVQLTPVYTSGPQMADKVHLTTADTTSPIELDQIYGNIDALNQALGSNGANSKGALSDLLSVAAKNLAGNGDNLHGTLDGLSQAVSTLANSRTDLFGTINNLQQFTAVIANNDNTVRAFNSNLAQVAAQLNGERGDLATSIKQLGAALQEVAGFVKDNRTNLASNINELASVTNVLTHQKRALEEFLDTSPVALSDLQLAYNSKSGTLDTRDDSTSEGGVPGLLCNVLAATGQSVTACNTLLGGALGNNPPPTVPGLPPIPVVGGTAHSSALTRLPSVTQLLTGDLGGAS